MHPILNNYNLRNLLTIGSTDSITYSIFKQLIEKRIESLTSLGYIALLNPNFNDILNNHLNTYTQLLNDNLTNTINSFIENHANAVPKLASAVSQTSSDCYPTGKNSFLNDHLSDRILTHLIAQNHLSIKNSGNPLLSKLPTIESIINSSTTFVNSLTEQTYADSINTSLTINESIKSPFIYPPTHLEYILTEILKNAARASLESKSSNPIKILLVRSNENSLTIRITDNANGIPSNILPHIWEYSFSTSLTKGSVAGMGYGLPLARTYANLLGGDIQLHTIQNKGTSVYIHINQL
ncbi:hypothetical protein CANINC_004151 [Pichia inconspicua]|uniref:Protein-serine/threonine kinase n=1 Tax=Pichia inconspicua TaxID=52247 RepID=A0A4T0WWV4_9ASCO|nr:hypothetical protein CANINC_004151 [[Candida] inconspicua]